MRNSNLRVNHYEIPRNYDSKHTVLLVLLIGNLYVDPELGSGVLRSLQQHRFHPRLEQLVFI